MIEQVLSFWFERHGPDDWWAKEPAFDAAIRSEFGALHASAALGELHDWREGPDGRLAEIVVLDQFSRNLYREDPRAFACDGMALALAQEALRAGADHAVLPEQRKFFYMPYEHSESPRIHEIAVALFESLDDPRSLDYELQHKAIIDRFGRYPHRNKALGRASTAEEIAFLNTPNSSF
ncbi:MAG: DUF924 domain-containing protein [Rhodospirillales bacterium]|nr:DUF924 domain-containing protein [Rhodospirillales bacterium]